jgi:curli biogenesis system outer membrane secretion channel CsgG
MAQRFVLALTASAALLLGFSQPTAAQSSPHRPKVAVVAFEPTTAGWMVPPPQLGSTVAQLMMDRLVHAAQFHVFDGQWLVSVPGRRGATSADMLANARDAGLDYLLEGSITRLSIEQRTRRGGLAGIVPFVGFLRRDKHELAVSLVARLVDVRTGEIVRTATGDGTGSRRQLSGGGLGIARRALGAGGVSAGASGSRDAQLDEAVRRAVDAASKALIAAEVAAN